MPACPAPDACEACRQEVPWEWFPPVVLGGRTLSGTGQWRRQTIDGICYPCLEARQEANRADKRALAIRIALIRMLGGERFYEKADFAKYQVSDESRVAYERAKAFIPQWHNLYLWGACGVGKTHLASAIARKHAELEKTVSFLRPPQLMRRVRKKDPQEEQEIIDQIAGIEVLVLDELGIGNDTAFARQVFQEILDARIGSGRNGLVVTSKYSLDDLAQKLEEDTIPSRLAGLCQVIEVKGKDGRLGLSTV